MDGELFRQQPCLGRLLGRHTSCISPPWAWASAEQVSADRVLAPSWQIPPVGAGWGDAAPGSWPGRELLGTPREGRPCPGRGPKAGGAWTDNTLAWGGLWRPAACGLLASYTLLAVRPPSPHLTHGAGAAWPRAREPFAGLLRPGLGVHFIQAHRRSLVNVTCSPIRQARISCHGLRSTYVRITRAGGGAWLKCCNVWGGFLYRATKQTEP